MACYKCGHRSLTRDDISGGLVCESCGTLQQFDSYQANAWSADGPQGVLIRVGASGTGSVLNYREKKIYEANKIIDDITFRLDLVGQKVSEIKSMINEITEGEIGEGNWFQVLVGACAYIVLRSDNKSLSMGEIGNVIGCDVYELGRMINRVVDHLNLNLPEFDIVGSFEKVLKSLYNLERIEKDKYERMREQGIFLIQCAAKWFLTTGRRPMPVVAAVLALVAELNGVPDMKIEEMAKKVEATLSTCKSRYRELLESLVKVAQALPWGKDITVKNVVKNAPFVIRHMELKLMAKKGGDNNENSNCSKFPLEKAVSQCLSKDNEYSNGAGITENDDSRYFEVQNSSSFDQTGVADVDKLWLSYECLSIAYEKFLKGSGSEKGVRKSKRMLEPELYPMEWWNGKTEMSKKLLLKQIIEKDVGLNPMPPSFVNGIKAVERRRSKINAAKSRIGRIMHPDSSVNEVPILNTRKRKRKNEEKDIGWEDLVIETLLLHQVKEEEIESGHYNRLLDLYVFSS